MTDVTEDRDQPGLELSGLPRHERAPSPQPDITPLCRGPCRRARTRIRGRVRHSLRAAAGRFLIRRAGLGCLRGACAWRARDERVPGGRRFGFVLAPVPGAVVGVPRGGDRRQGVGGRAASPALLLPWSFGRPGRMDWYSDPACGSVLLRCLPSSSWVARSGVGVRLLSCSIKVESSTRSRGVGAG